MLTHYCFFCIYMQNSLTLQRVFHSIRFKVNKDWGLAKPLFLSDCKKTGYSNQGQIINSLMYVATML